MYVNSHSSSENDCNLFLFKFYTASQLFMESRFYNHASKLVLKCALRLHPAGGTAGGGGLNVQVDKL